MSDPYIPSMYAKMGHQLSNSEFAFTIEYAVAVAKAPIALFIIGFLSFLFLNGFLCSRYYDRCFWAKCVPMNDDAKSNDERVQKIRIWNIIFFFSLCVYLVFGVVSNNTSFYGYTSITTGLVKYESALDRILSIINQMKRYGLSLTDNSNSLQRHYNNAIISCPNVTTTSLSDDISSYDLNANDFFISFRPVTDQLEILKGYIDTYVIYYKDIGFYTIWSLAMLVFILISIFQYFRQAGWMRYSVGLAMQVFVLEIGVTSLLMVLASVFGDLCYANPTSTVLNSIEVGQATNILTYYSSCSGVNVLQTYFDTAKTNMISIQNTLSFFVSSGKCVGNTDIALLLTDVSIIQTAFIGIDSTITCTPVQNAWFTLFNEAMCGDMMKGVYFLWITQLITSFCMFMIIIFASISYEYFELTRMLDDVEE